jgi:AraC-like DNA-binding protein
MHQIRAVTLSGYLDVAAATGLDGAAMLREAGLSERALRDPERRIPALAAVRLIESSASESGREDFGLLMAERRSFASLGPVAMLLERLPNLREIVRTSIDFQRHFNDILEFALEDSGDACLIRLDLLPGYIGPRSIDLLVGVVARVFTGATGGSWRPEAVHLKHAAPENPAPWRRFFAAPIEFADTFNGFSTSREAMLRPNPLADAAMAANARRLLGLLPLESGPVGPSERVRRTITLLLPSGRASVGRVAAELGMGPRTLQRLLDKEGTGFAALRDAVRRELAEAYLAQPAHPITSIAGMLGYASPSAFTRWFAAAFGMSPQAWRVRADKRGGAAASEGSQSAVAGAARGKNGMLASNSRPSPSRKV